LILDTFEAWNRSQEFIKKLDAYFEREEIDRFILDSALCTLQMHSNQLDIKHGVPITSREKDRIRHQIVVLQQQLDGMV